MLSELLEAPWVSLRKDEAQLVKPFGLFDVTPVGLALVLATGWLILDSLMAFVVTFPMTFSSS